MTTNEPVPPTASICDRCGAHWGFEECGPACWEAARREGLELVAGGAETLMMRYKAERDEAVSLLREVRKFCHSVRPGGRVLRTDPDFEAIDTFLARIGGEG